MILVKHFTIVFVLSLIKDVQPQAQPCLVCGGATVRIWSLMSRQGDRYLRISRDLDPRSRHYKVDFAGKLDDDNFTSLLKIREKSTFRETRVQFVFKYNRHEYHLYAPSNSGELLAMPASQGEQETDFRNTFAPERLLYEHRLFTVFQSVKYRGYYLSCYGNGRTTLKPVINKAYRDPSDLFLTIDPGNAVRGVMFGSNKDVRRGKREMRQLSLENDNQKNPYNFHVAHQEAKLESRYKPTPKPRRNPKPRRRPSTRRSSKICVAPESKPTLRPRPAPPTRRQRPARLRPLVHSAVTTSVNLPDKITFVLCFWIKTSSTNAQLMSMVEHVAETHRDYWRKRHYAWVYSRRIINYNIFNITITRGYLHFEIGHRRLKSIAPNCMINDNKFHHICLSLDDRYMMDVYKDGKAILHQNMQRVSCDFVEKKNADRRRGTFTLGKPMSVHGETFIGSLFQVNLWDQYPSFRIQRIATNCACGEGSLVKWIDLLNGTMHSVRFSEGSDCPKLEGYNYDEITQNRLI